MAALECGLVVVTLRLPVWMVAVLDQMVEDARGKGEEGGPRLRPPRRSDLIREVLAAGLVNSVGSSETPPG